MQDLKNKVAVVTGAASGIGLALAKRFALDGMHVVLADIEAPRLELALQQVQALGAQAVALRTDVTSEEQVNALADAAFARFGAVHVLCNNAGVAVPGLMAPAWMSTVADWKWILDVNVMGVLHGVRAFVPRMIAGGQPGHVVNTASVAGLMTASNPYHVSKHAVSCMTEGLYKDFKRLAPQMSASVLCPGLINTDIMKAERNRQAEQGPATNLASLPDTVQQAVQQFSQALESGFDPALVAQAVADAIRADRFYVIPAQQPLQDMIDVRMNDILQRRNPTLPVPMFNAASVAASQSPD
jgi:NAD(P)-dependent dehydrogenase (short-subunit alcohol dehydrogenase family)